MTSMLRAQELRTKAAGPTHLLLALLDLPAEDVTRRALTAAKVTREGLDARGRSRGRGVSASPALRIVDAFAHGLAVARGDRHPSATDELLSLCWHPDAWLTDRDPRRKIVLSLKAAGVAVPPGPLPKWDPTRVTQRVEIDRAHLSTAIELLKERYPVGTHPKWGVNRLPRGRALLAAEDGVDLEAVAADAAHAHRRPPT